MASINLNNERINITYCQSIASKVSGGNTTFPYARSVDMRTDSNILTVGEKLPLDTNSRVQQTLTFDNGNYINITFAVIQSTGDININGEWKFKNGISDGTFSLVADYRKLDLYWCDCFISDSGEKIFGFSYIQSGQSVDFPIMTRITGKTNKSPFWEDIKITPYPPSGESSSGGNGNFNNDSDNIDLPQLPSGGVLSTNFVTMWHMTIPELSSLSSFLWGNRFDQEIKKLFSDPMEVIASLSISNFTAPLGGRNEIVLGNVETGIQSTLISNQYITLDCGTIKIPKYYDNFIDFSPYTKVQIYLPYLGINDLNTDDVMGKDINVTYYIDILTGGANIYIKLIDGDYTAVLYTFSCNVIGNIPVSGRNMLEIVNSLTNLATSTIMTAVTGIGGAVSLVGSVMNVATSKAHVQRSGRMDSSIGYLGIRKPYVIISRPQQQIPKNYGETMGYPCNMTANLKNLNGFTKVREVNLDGIDCTDLERNEIETLLKDGVIL